MSMAGSGVTFFDKCQGFRCGNSSPSAILENCLERFEAFEPQVKAFVRSDIVAARANADASSKRWRAGCQKSPIDGMPIGVKDIIETADFPTGMGSPLFDGWCSYRDAASVKALKAAGAIILGKTATTEFAATVPAATTNPHDPRRTPGGSSSGSAAAVAIGMVSASLGTQVVGSIIRPASYCGCIGFKPTLGGINRGGSHDYLSQSCTGVLGASLADTWNVAWQIAIRAGGDPGFIGIVGPEDIPPPRMPRCMALLETAGWSRASSNAQAAFNLVLQQLEKAGVTLLSRHESTALSKLEEALLEAFELTLKINTWESRWPLNSYLDRNPRLLSQTMAERLACAEKMTLADYREFLTARERLRHLHAEMAAQCDGILTLSAPDCAPLGLNSTGDPAFAVPASILGAPALSLPVLHTQGLPLGLQVIGFPQRDAEVFSSGAWIEAQITRACLAESSHA